MARLAPPETLLSTFKAMKKILITEFMHPPSVEELASCYAVHYDPDLVDKPEELAARARGCEALIVRNRTRVDAALLDAAGTQLRVVGRLGVGMERIDLEECSRRGVRVIPATGSNDNAVAEYVITGVLMLLRGAYQCSAEVLSGSWPRLKYQGHEILGKTLGIIGFGAIGRSTADKARALGMKVLAHDPYVKSEDSAWARHGAVPAVLEELLESVQAVSLNVPLTATTHHLIGAVEIARMPRGAVIVNSCRGGVVDEAALCAALRSGHLGGALLDVYEHEPLPADSGLIGVPNLILTPHIAGVSHESNRCIGEMIAQGVHNALQDSS